VNRPDPALRAETFRATFARLKEVLALPADPLTRDAAILRFELVFETAWKAAQSAVRAQGLEAQSPRQAFGQAFRLGWVTDETFWCDLIDARNAAIHTYSEAMAEALYRQLPGFLPHFEELLRALVHDHGTTPPT
jgi:nucleotidyltransferase substrate binding protein (TIGR01987 family)